MAKYDKYTTGVKQADNFIRTFNRQLSTAYKTGGETSRTYKNLLSTARTYFTNKETGETFLKTSKSGAFQISRGIKALETYAKKQLPEQLTKAMYKTNKYGKPVKKHGKKELKPFYSAKKAYENAKNKLKQKGNKKPSKDEIVKQMNLDDKTAELFNAYKEYETGAVDERVYSYWQQLGKRVHEDDLTESEIDKLLKDQSKLLNKSKSSERDLTTRFKSGIMLK